MLIVRSTRCSLFYFYLRSYTRLASAIFPGIRLCNGVKRGNAIECNFFSSLLLFLLLLLLLLLFESMTRTSQSSTSFSIQPLVAALLFPSLIRKSWKRRSLFRFNAKCASHRYCNGARAFLQMYRGDDHHWPALLKHSDNTHTHNSTSCNAHLFNKNQKMMMAKKENYKIKLKNQKRISWVVPLCMSQAI